MARALPEPGSTTEAVLNGISLGHMAPASSETKGIFEERVGVRLTPEASALWGAQPVRHP